MNVYLVPIAVDRYELYCEVREPAVPPEPPKGVWRRLLRRFSAVVAEAEREGRRAPSRAADERAGWPTRAKRRLLQWIAKSIAEQRLLWALRGQAGAQLLYPDDLAEAQARAALRHRLSRDFERHRFWLAIDSLGLIASAALILLPGPNLFGYYFAFRIVGHFLSVRGARQGLNVVVWSACPSAPLSALRGMLAEPPAAREARVREVAHLLCLEHFPSFFQRATM
ncbi:MAG TPA: hypothetical protein VFX12_06885 [Vicinamibacterales bacterium]|nr:hypothetical protein [Vicinamibacterales bacterium]